MQVLRDAARGDPAPVLAAVGPLQFEVAVDRLEHEFGAPVDLDPAAVVPLARRTDEEGAQQVRRSSLADVLIAPGWRAARGSSRPRTASRTSSATTRP